MSLTAGGLNAETTYAAPSGVAAGSNGSWLRWESPTGDCIRVFARIEYRRRPRLQLSVEGRSGTYYSFWNGKYISDGAAPPLPVEHEGPAGAEITVDLPPGHTSFDLTGHSIRALRVT